LQDLKRGIDQHHSTVPLVSFFITVFAMMVYRWPWMLLVPLLDIGNWVLVWAPFGLVWQMCRKSTAEPPASPDGGPAEPLGNSAVSGGPPSVC